MYFRALIHPQSNVFFFLERPATYTQEWQKCLFINIANVLLQLAYHWAQKVLTQSSLDHSYKY